MSIYHGGLGTSVLYAAQERIRVAFDNFKRIYVSFSAGKDSSVMLHLVMAEAIQAAAQSRGAFCGSRSSI